jgi:hypothetical protein
MMSEGVAQRQKFALYRETLRTTGPVSPGDFLIAKESLRRSLLRHLLASASHHTERSVCVFKAWRNLSGPMGLQHQNQTLGRDRAASRWSAPSPGKRTRREDHAPSHRPQMSSGRLFLDRVGRHQSPSPLIVIPGIKFDLV